MDFFHELCKHSFNLRVFPLFLLFQVDKGEKTISSCYDSKTEILHKMEDQTYLLWKERKNKWYWMRETDVSECSKKNIQNEEEIGKFVIYWALCK